MRLEGVQDVERLLAVMRANKVRAFEVGDLKVSFDPLALVPDHRPAAATPVALEPESQETPASILEDPDITYSVEE